MNLARLIVSAATSLCIANANAGSDIVLIDHMEKAYTVYAGLPLDRAEVTKSKLEGKPVDMVPFEQFVESQKKIIGDRVVRNDYQGERTEEGIVALIKKYPGTPFGVTWNGGIAYTRNDYQAAKKAFESFNTSGGFTKPEPEKDPVAPMNHLKPLLGW
ncbi:hypothetical protein [Propionivibrio sp.]|uniref:hypothetical protein n=1 Tax=Propionivibrio sp. TaxID=2212460 RepID=UPI003BEFB065